MDYQEVQDCLDPSAVKVIEAIKAILDCLEDRVLLELKAPKETEVSPGFPA